jgi:non-ribosomal peptide synthetase-like protein
MRGELKVDRSVLTMAALTTELVEASANSGVFASPTSRTESAFVEVLSGVVQVDGVSVESHFFDDLGADSMVMAQFCARVRKRADLPSVSIKDIYQHPTIKSLAASLTKPALTPTESSLVEVLSGVMQVDGVTVESHFFDDLGADSMVMAQFGARVRKRADLPSVSIKDIYQHPTIKSLAAAFADSAPTPTAKTVPAGVLPAPTPTGSPVPATMATAPPASTGQYIVCGMLQLLTFLGYTSLYVTIASRGYLWVAAATGGIDIYLRSVLFGGGVFVSLCVLPIVGKWVLVGRWKRQQIRVWSLSYFRFWFVKTLIRTSPLALMVGSPLYVLYLRALGARVGKGVAIFSPTPVCTDLLTIGDGTVVRKGAFLSCYRAHAGVIETGSVTLGREVVISETTVLDIETSMGDRAQLGHSSSLHSGQAVPAGERWHGSPAQRTEVDYRAVRPTDCGTLRRVLYPLSQLLVLVLVSLPLVIGGAVILVAEVPQIPALLDSADRTPASLSFYREALVASFVLLFGGLIVGLLIVGIVPRLLNLAIEPNKVYPLYGIHYLLHRTIARRTNVKIFMYLFGDSSYVVHYLRYLGYNLNKVVQTGSNFGTGVVHESPYLSSVGSGTVVADGLSINNADYSSTSFRVSQTTIGAHNFLGNNIAYPSQGKTGDNCLLATKAMVPIDGKVREGVGLLGSPSFEIPRSVLRDTNLELESTERRRRLVAKNKHNLGTLALALLVRWMHVYALTMLAMLVADLYRRFGLPALVVQFLAFVLFTLAYFIVVERASTGFRRLRPQYCSIYDPYFWWHERFWKLSIQGLQRLFTGTPFRTIMLRLLGVRMGRRVFDDGCAFPERTLVTVGDYCTLNAGSIIQGHSQEDGAFKSDYITIGSGCTVGVGAWVHYGVTMGDGVVLAPDSFLMKGEQVPEHAEWGGNPAEEMPGSAADLSIGSRTTPGSSPAETWSWDLDSAVLAAPARPRWSAPEPWSWDREGAVRAPDSHSKNGKQVRQHGHGGGKPAGGMPAHVAPFHEHRSVPEQRQISGTTRWAVPPGASGVGVQSEGKSTPSRPGLTLVRRGVGAAAVLFLLGSAVVYYRGWPGVPTSGSRPVSTANPFPSTAPTSVGTPSAPTGGSSSSAGPSRASDPSPPTSSATAGAGPTTSSGSAAAKTIQVEAAADSAQPYQTVRIPGTYRGGADTLLRVQRWEGGKWLAFPLPMKSDQSGRFTIYVEFGRPGRYQLRVLDPDSGLTSKPFVLVIKR